MTKGTYKTRPLIGGSWLVIRGVISKVTIVITHIRGLITLLITTHEPPSTLPAFSWGLLLHSALQKKLTALGEARKVGV